MIESDDLAVLKSKLDACRKEYFDAIGRREEARDDYLQAAEAYIAALEKRVR